MLKKSGSTQQVSPVAAVSGGSSTSSDGAAYLTAATASLLACRTAEEVFDTIGRFLLLLAPESVVVINELSPQEDSLTTVKVYGVSSETLQNVWELTGFNPIGKASAIVPKHRD